MINADRQKVQFEERLKRIAAGGSNTMTQVYVGPVEEDSKGRPRKQRQASALPPLRETIGYPLSIIGAFGLGLIAVLITRWVRFTLMGGSMTGEDPDITMAIDAGLALAIGFVLKSAFRLKGSVRETAKTIGIFVMIATMHNLVHSWPGLFERTFSPEWVTEVVETTEPKSILFRGISFVVGEDQTKSAMPKLVELDND